MDLQLGQKGERRQRGRTPQARRRGFEIRSRRSNLPLNSVVLNEELIEPARVLRSNCNLGHSDEYVEVGGEPWCALKRRQVGEEDTCIRKCGLRVEVPHKVVGVRGERVEQGGDDT